MRMLVPEVLNYEPERDKALLRAGALPAELDFYESYAWCLNPHLTVGETIDHLCEETERLAIMPPGWQTGEATTNVFLFCCGILNCVDEYLRGPGLRLPRKLAA